ncbi:acyl-CoA dehydrogenase [Parapedobacter sp.]
MENYNIQGVSAGLAERLRQFSALAENEGSLTADQLAIIYDFRWFKLFVPNSLGGLEWSVPEGVRLEEELARIDGSLGWTVTLCAGANLFVGYMDRSVTGSVFADPKVCLGGSGQATGKAVIDGDRYRVSGRWRYATGAPHLTHFTANCTLEQDGRKFLDSNGNPVIHSFFFPKADVRIISDWNAFGLKATASHSFEVDNLTVDRSQAFLITPDAATWHHPIYRYPFLPFAEATLAVNTLGMARHFLECAAELDVAGLRKSVQAAESQLKEARESFYRVLDYSWNELLRVGECTAETFEPVSRWSRELVKVSRKQVVALFPHVGMAGADASSEINRVWRDIFTASQHSLLRS